MNKKRILLVSSAFYPEISPRSFRATELAKEFCRQGHEVTVITRKRDFDYSSFLDEFPVELKMWHDPSLFNLPNSKIKIVKLFSKILTRIIEFPNILFMNKVKKMLEKEQGYDLMISFAVPHPVHWGVAKVHPVKKQISKVWVADCGDPYMLSRFDSFPKPFYFKRYEMDFCEKCDHITVPFIDLRKQFYPQFSDKIVEIPQGFNFDEIKISDTKHDNKAPVFIYAGSVIPGIRDLDNLLDFLKTYDKEFLFIVYTNQFGYYKKYKEILGEKLQIKGFIDRLSLIYEMSKADFLVNVDTVHDNKDNTEAIPSKLIDYALSGRPILNINSADLDKDNLIRFLNKDYSGRRMINKNNYDIKKVAKSFLDLT